MKSFAILAAALSVISAASAASIHKVRQGPAQPASYTVTVVTSDGQTNVFQSVDGYVYAGFDPSTAFVESITINDPSLTAQCFTDDSQGNQVRAFGGPNFGDVESVQFVQQDGQQIFSLACDIA